MADAMPDYHVEQQRIIAQLASLNHNMQRQRLEIMEMNSRKAKILENIQSTKKAIVDLNKDLEGLVLTHGKAPDIKDE